MTPPPRVVWAYSGPPDPLCGTGATPAERLLAHASAAVFTLLLLLLDRLRPAPLAPAWRAAALALLAYDVAGGAVANQLNSCKRFYHSAPAPAEPAPARLAKNPRLFTALHVQPVLAALVLPADLPAACAWYVLLQLAVAVVLALPLYLRRPAATALVVLAVIANDIRPLGDGLRWFVPVLFVKMLIGHAVREEPYAPDRVQPSAKQH